jgi:indole-3-glycerol phosphate synthase / phosphoribosylanthranilate isomerase
MESFLEKIGKIKLEELKAAPSREALDLLRDSLPAADGRFLRALDAGVIKDRLKEQESACIIAEFKPASPSAGVLNDKISVDEVAGAYAQSTAISVLTDSHFFGGSFELFAELRAVTDKPLLCKDFILSRYQVYRARQCGADAVLLIVKLLNRELLAELYREITDLNMTAVVEVQTVEELCLAEELGSDVILINNRNLDTLKMDLGTTARLAPLVHKARHVIAASGVENCEDLRKLRRHARIFLIGSALMKAGDPAGTLARFISAAQGAVLPKVKFCGFTRLDDAKVALRLGVDYLGLIFAGGSSRRVTVEEAEPICRALKGYVKLVGVFKDEDLSEVNRIVRRLELDLVQYHGVETPEQCRLTACPVIKTFELSECFDRQALAQYRDSVSYYLFDRAKDNENSSWLEQSIKLLSSLAIDKPYFFAGGLSRENVAYVLEALQPFALDVASSIESFPGLKNKDKMTDFVFSVRGRLLASQGVK